MEGCLVSFLVLLSVIQIATFEVPQLETKQDIFARVPNWTILRNRKSADCRMGTFYKNGTQVLIYFNTANRRADFTFSNEAWQSLKVGQKKKLRIVFFPSNRFASGEGAVVSSRNGGGVAINLGFSDGLTLLNDFSRAKFFNLAADDISLGSFPLDGSSRAIELLINCAVELATEGAAGDPFAKN